MNLSKCRMRALYCSKQDIVYSEERVKEFIKKLKLEFQEIYTPSLFGEILSIIDKLAGEKLI